MDVFDLVAKISLDRSDYDSGLDSIRNGVSSFGTSISNSFQTAFKVGSAAIGAATTAMAAFGKSSVDAGMDFDNAMSQVAATMGMTNEELNNTKVTTDEFTGTLRDFAQELGSTTAFSATQCADALNYMALAGYTAEEAVNTLPNVLNLAAAGNIDLARASDMVTDAQTALGLNLEETEAMVDQMAKTSSKSNTSVEQLGDAFLTIGATAKSLSGGTAELSTLLGVLADNGTKGSEAGIHLRNIMAALNGLTDEGSALMSKYTNGLYDAEGKMRPISEVLGELRDSMEGMNQAEQDSVIQGIFNKTDWADARALIETTDERWKSLNETIIDSKGAAADMAATQLDNLAGDITLFKSALEGAQIAVSDQLTPTLREFVQFGAQGLGTLTEAFKEGGLTGAMDALGQLLSDGLTMVVEKAPEMVQAGVQLLSALGQGFMDNLPTIIDAVTQVATIIGENLVKAIPQVISAGLEILKSLADTITSNLDTIIPAVMEVVSAIAKGLIEYRVLLLETGIQIILALAEYITEALPEMLDYIIGIVEHISEIIIKNLPMLLEAAVKIIVSLATYLSEHLPEMIPAIISIMETIVKVLLDNIDQLINAALQLIVAIANGLVEALPRLQEKVPEIIKTIVEVLIRNLPQIIAAALEIILALGSGLIKALPDLILMIPEIINAIVDGLMDGIEDFKDTGIQLIEGLWEGIKEKWSELVENVTELGGNLVRKVRDVFDINSPSRVFRQIGEFCVEGFEEGSDELFSTEGLTARVSAEVTTSSTVRDDKLDSLIKMLDEYLPGLATKDSFSNIGISVDRREFGRLVSEVG